jgi:Ca2+-binding EF-hand superfamily protein
MTRLFEFFDFDSKGFVDWNSFFSAITICYFGTERNLALLMFMVFDHSLDFKLEEEYQKLMLQCNEAYLRTE